MAINWIIFPQNLEDSLEFRRKMVYFVYIFKHEVWIHASLWKLLILTSWRSISLN